MFEADRLDVGKTRPRNGVLIGHFTVEIGFDHRVGILLRERRKPCERSLDLARVFATRVDLGESITQSGQFGEELVFCFWLRLSRVASAPAAFSVRSATNSGVFVCPNLQQWTWAVLAPRWIDVVASSDRSFRAGRSVPPSRTGPPGGHEYGCATMLTQIASHNR